MTPKFGLQYQLTERQHAVRHGGQGLPGGRREPADQRLRGGLRRRRLRPPTTFPTSYSPDTVWSYEAGGKFRLMDRKMQLNVAAYRIDWTNVQARPWP